MNPEIWGPHYWFVIHSIAMNYPNNPNAVQKKDHYKFVQSLPQFIPDLKSSNNFINLIKLYPVLPYLDSRKDFVKWTHFIHNRVNEDLGKDLISLNDFYSNYYDTYNIDERNMKNKNNKSIQLYFIIIFLLSTSAFMISKRKY